MEKNQEEKNETLCWFTAQEKGKNSLTRKQIRNKVSAGESPIKIRREKIGEVSREGILVSIAQKEKLTQEKSPGITTESVMKKVPRIHSFNKRVGTGKTFNKRGCRTGKAIENIKTNKPSQQSSGRS